MYVGLFMCSTDELACREWIGCLGLTEHDRGVLRSNDWLNANHISAASKLLRISLPNQNGLVDSTVLCEKAVWASELSNFVQIIHVNNNHWACLSNVYSKDESSFELYDSLHSNPCDSIVRQVSIICSSSNLNTQVATIDVMNVSRQTGVNDCGLYAIAMATSLVYGADPVALKYSQDSMRAHLLSCFSNLKMTCFNGLRYDIQEEKRVLKQYSIDLSNFNTGTFRKHMNSAVMNKNCLVSFPLVTMKSQAHRVEVKNQASIEGLGHYLQY